MIRRRCGRPRVVAAGVMVVLTAAVAGCGHSGSSVARATHPAGLKSTSVPLTLPDGSRTLLPGHRVVAYYGAAGAPALGVLGTASANGIWSRLSRQAAAYDGGADKVMPAYELIAYVATGSPGSSGNYSQRVPAATLDSYAAAARAHHALLVLDIQPGRGSFLDDAKTLTPWLTQPGVALALDPEWKLTAHQKPDVQIGHTDAHAINVVSGWLDQLTAAHHLPQKLLLIHQFTVNEIRDKPQVVTRSHLAMVFNMDGFGARAIKLTQYRLLASDHRFPLGMKLFYRQDPHRFTPGQTKRLSPSPVVVDYE